MLLPPSPIQPKPEKPAMVGVDGGVLHTTNNNNNNSNLNFGNNKENPSPRKAKDKRKKKKKKKRGGSRAKMTLEQTLAFKSVSEWVYLDSKSNSSSVDDFGVQKNVGKGEEKMVFEWHAHTKFSDGFLTPTKLVERAHAQGVSEDVDWFMMFCFSFSICFSSNEVWFLVFLLSDSNKFCRAYASLVWF